MNPDGAAVQCRNHHPCQRYSQSVFNRVQRTTSPRTPYHFTTYSTPSYSAPLHFPEMEYNKHLIRELRSHQVLWSCEIDTRENRLFKLRNNAWRSISNTLDKSVSDIKTKVMFLISVFFCVDKQLNSRQENVDDLIQCQCFRTTYNTMKEYSFSVHSLRHLKNFIIQDQWPIVYKNRCSKPRECLNTGTRFLSHLPRTTQKKINTETAHGVTIRNSVSNIFGDPETYPGAPLVELIYDQGVVKVVPFEKETIEKSVQESSDEPINDSNTQALYGKYIEEKIQNYNETTRSIVKQRINDILSKADAGEIDD